MAGTARPTFTRATLANEDASVKSTLPPRFWSVDIVFAAFFGLLAVTSMNRVLDISAFVGIVCGK